MDLAGIRSILRRRIGDMVVEGEEPKNDNITLDDAILASIREYSHYFPRHKEVSIEVEKGVQDYALDCFQILLVREPDNTEGMRTKVAWEGTLLEEEDSDDLKWSYLNGNLRFFPAPTSSGRARLVVETWHTLPQDPSQSITISEIDWDMLILYSHFWLIRGDASKDALLQRFDKTPGRRDDNPVEYLSDRLQRDYHATMQQRRSLRANPG